MRVIHFMCLTAALALLVSCGGGGGGSLRPGDLTPGAADFTVGSRSFYWVDGSTGSEKALVATLSMEDDDDPATCSTVAEIRLLAQSDDPSRPYEAKVWRGGGGGVIYNYTADLATAKTWVESEVRAWYSQM
jgi:hypothetical protein